MFCLVCLSVCLSSNVQYTLAVFTGHVFMSTTINTTRRLCTFLHWVQLYCPVIWNALPVYMRFSFLMISSIAIWKIAIWKTHLFSTTPHISVIAALICLTNVLFIKVVVTGMITWVKWTSTVHEIVKEFSTVCVWVASHVWIFTSVVLAALKKWNETIRLTDLLLYQRAAAVPCALFTVNIDLSK